MNAATQVTRSRLRHHEPLARHTSWRVGGPADVYFEPRDVADLQAFLAELPAALPVLWLGLGSNLLMRDGGFRGAVVCIGRGFAGIEPLPDNQLRAGAGRPCAKLAQHCARTGLAGGEFLAGVPGTVGGALAMNAGAHGGETWQRVQAVLTVDRQGRLHQRLPTDYRIGYRSVQGPAEECFLAADFAFSAAPPQQVQAAVHALLRRRAATQPLRQANAGSVFRNPEGDFAARLIEAAGLKGLTRGKAQVSLLHANFIVNLGGARAADIETLIDEVQARVEAASGIRLQPEVRRLGEPA
ncbi:UDP-N-acetylmuramate dehydrogenase [Immundisolibacter sp.]|uniref:UDP-N-acetylmuramate dehydrogenase n=1 Tax=Immundisolibacter sp. TaxID=1934948 RepID=UPI0035673F5C